MRNIIIIMLALSFSAVSHAAKKKSYKRDPLKSLNSLGADEQILDKVKSYKSKEKIKVIQRRAVRRSNRLEFGVNYGVFSGGDPYTNSNAFGGQIDYHFNPQFSVGLRMNKYTNYLNAEGKNVMDFSVNNPSAVASTFDLDNILSSQTVSLNWYPVYGKMNLFDWKVAQFDFYFLVEGGQMKLESGDSTTMAYGGGLGVWLAQNISTRMEVKYQTYSDVVISGSRDQEMLSINFALGFLL